MKKKIGLITSVILTLTLLTINLSSVGALGIPHTHHGYGTPEFQDDIKLIECEFTFNDPTFVHGIYHPSDWQSKGTILHWINENQEFGSSDEWRSPFVNIIPNPLNDHVDYHGIASDGSIYGIPQFPPPYPNRETLVPLVKLEDSGDNFIYLQCDYKVGDRKINFYQSKTYLTIYTTQEFDSDMGSIDKNSKLYKPDEFWWYEPAPHGPPIATHYDVNSWSSQEPSWESDGYERVIFYTGGAAQFSYIKDDFDDSIFDSDSYYSQNKIRRGFYPNTEPSERWKLDINDLPTSLVEVTHELIGTNNEPMIKAVGVFYIQSDESVIPHLLPQEIDKDAFGSNDYRYLIGDDYPKSYFGDFFTHIEMVPGNEIDFYPSFYNPFMHSIYQPSLSNKVVTQCKKMPQLCKGWDMMDLSSSSRPLTFAIKSKSYRPSSMKPGEWIDIDYDKTLLSLRRSSSVIGSHKKLPNDEVTTFNGVGGIVMASTKSNFGPATAKQKAIVRREYNIGSDKEAYLAFHTPDHKIGAENGKITFKATYGLAAKTGFKGEVYPSHHYRNNIDVDPADYEAEFRLYYKDPSNTLTPCQKGTLIDTKIKDLSSFNTLEVNGWGTYNQFVTEEFEIDTDEFPFEKGLYCIKVLGKKKANTDGKFDGKYVAVPYTVTLFSWDQPLRDTDGNYDLMFTEQSDDDTQYIKVYNPTLMEKEFYITISDVEDPQGQDVTSDYMWYFNGQIMDSPPQTYLPGVYSHYETDLEPYEEKIINMRVERVTPITQTKTDTFKITTSFAPEKSSYGDLSEEDVATSNPVTYNLVNTYDAPPWFDIWADPSVPNPLVVTAVGEGKTMNNLVEGDTVHVNARWRLEGDAEGYAAVKGEEHYNKFGIVLAEENRRTDEHIVPRFFTNYVRPTNPQNPDKNPDTREGAGDFVIEEAGEYVAFLEVDWDRFGGNGRINEKKANQESGEGNNRIYSDSYTGQSFTVGERIIIHDDKCNLPGGGTVGQRDCYVDPDDPDRIIKRCYFSPDYETYPNHGSGGPNDPEPWKLAPTTSCEECDPEQGRYKTLCTSIWPDTWCEDSSHDDSHDYAMCIDIPQECLDLLAQGDLGCSLYTTETKEICEADDCDFASDGICVWHAGECSEQTIITCTIPGTSSHKVDGGGCYYDEDEDSDTYQKLQICSGYEQWTDATCSQCSDECPSATPWCHDDEEPQCSKYPEDEDCVGQPDEDGCYDGKSCRSLSCEDYENENSCIRDEAICNFGDCVWDDSVEPPVCTVGEEEEQEVPPTVNIYSKTTRACDMSGTYVMTTLTESAATEAKDGVTWDGLTNTAKQKGVHYVDIKTQTLNCAVTTAKIPFFTLMNFILVIGILALIYVIYLLRKTKK